MRAFGIFNTKMEGGKHCISKAAMIDVLDIDDCMFLCEECLELGEPETSEMNIFQHLEISLDDVIQDHTGQIAVEPDMSNSNDIDEGLELTGEHHWTCDNPRPTFEDGRVRLVEIIVWMREAHIVSHPKVDTMFAVEHVAEDCG